MSNSNHDPKTGEFTSGASGHNAGGGNRNTVNKIIAEHNKPIGYHIIYTQSNKVVGKARSSRGANQSVDARDNAYGGYRHRRIPIYDKEKF